MHSIVYFPLCILLYSLITIFINFWNGMEIRNNTLYIIMNIWCNLYFSLLESFFDFVSETIDSIADPPIPCVKTSDCRNMSTLPDDAFCKGGFCMCPKADIDVQACSSINASMHKNKTSGDTIGKATRIC